MHLSYRGIKYDSQNSARSNEAGKATRRYRGTRYQPKQVTEPIERPNLELTYRGVVYKFCSKEAKKMATMPSINPA